MVVQALLLALVMFIVKFLDWGFLNISPRPIWIGPLVGLALGDLKSGIMIGATLEAVFMGTFTVGGSVPSDITAAAVFGTGFGILLNQGTNKAVALAVPIGLLAVLLFNLVCLLFNFVVSYEDKVVENHNDKAFTRAHYFAMFFYPAVYAVMTFVVIVFGTSAVQSFMDMLPAAVNRMLNVMSQVLPALGFGILVKSMCGRDMFPFYFVGFIVAAYLKMDTMGIAVLGGAFAIYYILKDFRTTKELDSIRKSASTLNVSKDIETNELEDFLS